MSILFVDYMLPPLLSFVFFLLLLCPFVLICGLGTPPSCWHIGRYRNDNQVRERATLLIPLQMNPSEHQFYNCYSKAMVMPTFFGPAALKTELSQQRFFVRPVKKCFTGHQEKTRFQKFGCLRPFLRPSIWDPITFKHDGWKEKTPRLYLKLWEYWPKEIFQVRKVGSQKCFLHIQRM